MYLLNGVQSCLNLSISDRWIDKMVKWFVWIMHDAQYKNKRDWIISFSLKWKNFSFFSIIFYSIRIHLQISENIQNEIHITKSFYKKKNPNNSNAFCVEHTFFLLFSPFCICTVAFWHSNLQSFYCIQLKFNSTDGLLVMCSTSVNINIYCALFTIYFFKNSDSSLIFLVLVWLYSFVFQHMFKLNVFDCINPKQSKAIQSFFHLWVFIILRGRCKEKTRVTSDTFAWNYFYLNFKLIIMRLFIYTFESIEMFCKC